MSSHSVGDAISPFFLQPNHRFTGISIGGRGAKVLIVTSPAKRRASAPLSARTMIGSGHQLFQMGSKGLTGVSFQSRIAALDLWFRDRGWCVRGASWFPNTPPRSARERPLH